jgi:hypothetical protein
MLGLGPLFLLALGGSLRERAYNRVHYSSEREIVVS